MIGKPDVEEIIIDITPNHAKIGPRFKQKSKTIIKYLSAHKKEIIEIIMKKGDITWKDIPVIKENDDECLVENDLIKLKKETHAKGMKEQSIIAFDQFYLQVHSEVIS